MKELWDILMSKLKLVEPMEALIMICVMFSIGMITIICSKLFFLISEIVLSFNGSPLG